MKYYFHSIMSPFRIILSMNESFDLGSSTVLLPVLTFAVWDREDDEFSMSLRHAVVIVRVLLLASGHEVVDSLLVASAHEVVVELLVESTHQ